jgi:hypothetical protein
MTAEEIFELALWRLAAMFDGQAGERMAHMRKVARDALAQGAEARKAVRKIESAQDDGA